MRRIADRIKRKLARTLVIAKDHVEFVVYFSIHCHNEARIEVLGRFYWVFIGNLLELSGFYLMLLGYTGFHSISLGFTRFHWVILLGITGFYSISLNFTGPYWVLVDSTRF